MNKLINIALQFLILETAIKYCKAVKAKGNAVPKTHTYEAAVTLECELEERLCWLVERLEQES